MTGSRCDYEIGVAGLGLAEDEVPTCPVVHLGAVPGEAGWRCARCGALLYSTRVREGMR